ncbi:MAG: hypothetical protein ABIE84_04730 [bacterium]
MFKKLLCFIVVIWATQALALQFEEIYRIRIENEKNGTILVSRNEGFSWEAVGKVLYPTEKVSKGGYAAAKWVGEGRVAASAVNAIHLKVGPKDDRTIFSVLPKEFLKSPGNYRSFLSPDSSIYTDIPAGTGIFGGGFAPYVGNVVMVSSPGKPYVPLSRDYVPQLEDVFFIIVSRPTWYPKQIVFENKFGGNIYVEYPGEKPQVIGEVMRPVVGVGRFEGTRYASSGRIRANHAGVIDVSTSPLDVIGGFQIVPSAHGEDMGYVREATQWMVIGPANAEDPSLEGLPPFFQYFIQPNYRPTDLEDEDWYNKLLERFLVEVKYAGEDKWKPMPVWEIHDFYLNKKMPAWTDNALRGVEQIRILFPVD